MQEAECKSVHVKLLIAIQHLYHHSFLPWDCCTFPLQLECFRVQDWRPLNHIIIHSIPVLLHSCSTLFLPRLCCAGKSLVLAMCLFNTQPTTAQQAALAALAQSSQENQEAQKAQETQELQRIQGVQDTHGGGQCSEQYIPGGSGGPLDRLQAAARHAAALFELHSASSTTQAPPSTVLHPANSRLTLNEMDAGRAAR